MTLDITGAVWRLRMTYAAPIGGDSVRQFVDLAGSLAGLPLLRFRFDQIDTSAVYRYRIWLTDGRLWDQTITFASANDPDPSMTFSVSVGWRLSEFEVHRELRNFAVRMRNMLGASVVRIDPV